MAVELWPDKEAQQILKKHGAETTKTYVFETGFGPSGKPHFGTFGEVVRTNYVMAAMKQLGYQTRLIAFSDDMDGLRKIPDGFPDWLSEHIGKPVSAIPDPFGDCHSSYAAHMNALLVEMLQELNVEFEFRSSTEVYRAGVFNDVITTVVRNYEQVQEIVFPYLRDETKENWFPIFPICENCGSIGHTRVTNVDKDNLLLTYICDRPFGKRAPCGHTGTINPLDGRSKMQWKVDWAARWHALGVNYEMFGKDLIESAEVGDKIVQRVFRGKPPVHMFYELFLAEDASKISKSKGQGMTAEQWQRYGSKDSLMMLMLDKPREAKRLYPGVVPRYMEMVAKAAEAYYAGNPQNEAQERDFRSYQFIHLFNPPAEAPIPVDYGTVANLVGNVGLSDPVIVEDYLRRSNLIPAEMTAGQRQQLHTLIGYARRYYDEQMSLEQEAPRLDAQDGYLLGQLVAYLEAAEYEPDVIHNELFQIARRNNVEPNKFFRAMYTALIKQERGPRGGQFIKLLGQAKAAELIRQRVAESLAAPVEAAAQQPAAKSSLPVSIDPAVREKYPDLYVGVAVLEGVKVVGERPVALDEQIKAAIAACANTDLEVALKNGAIGAYRALYPTFGANPNGNPPSSEAMLRMALREKRLPAVNNLVDAVNLTVLETGLSAAVYDLPHLDAPLTLRLTEKGEKHLPIGSKHYESVEANELVYADQEEVICRMLNHRDSDKSKITTKTTTVLLIIDGAPGIALPAVASTLQQAVDRIRTYAGGSVTAQAILM